MHISEQSPDIAGGVHVGKDDMDVGAGDQGIMFGYASDETSDYMPLTHSMATRLGKTLTEVRKSGECWWLRPDGKTQVTIEYPQHPEGSVEPKENPHCGDFHSTRRASESQTHEGVHSYTGPEMTAPSMETRNKKVQEKVTNILLRTSNQRTASQLSRCTAATPTFTSIQKTNSLSMVPR